jgi:hypothetical protein
LIDAHEEIFQDLITDLNFDNSRLVKGIMFLVCMMSKQNGDYSQKVMRELIQRFYAIRA